MVRRKAGPGSITQWISTCQCDELKFDPQDDEAKEQIMLCSACNKRISAGRVGSLTQWVFRSDLCACEKPSPVATTRHTATSGSAADSNQEIAHQFSDQDFVDQIDKTMSVDIDSFPSERYLALSEIGKGVSGIVYRAIDRMLQKEVAIKCLKSVTANELMAFQKEAQATSRLNHLNIVKVFDFGASPGGAPYMVMEFVSGISLKQLIDEDGPLEEHEALPLFLDLANALAHAHSKGIFHRDIKSSNVLISERIDNSGKQNVSLIDFGVASLKGLESPFEKNTVLVGTPLYMAPDQVAGKAFDARSEIYSLGCLFYETLTGDPPFIGETALETLNMHANRSVVPLFQARPDRQFSEDVEGLVLSCLAKQPELRFQSMENLAYAIEGIIAHSATMSAKPVSANDSASASELSAGARKLKLTVVVFGIGILAVAIASLLFNRLAPFSGAEAPQIVYRHTESQLPTTVTEWAPPEEKAKFTIESGRATIHSGNDESLAKLANRADVTELDLSKCQFTEKGVAYVLPLKLDCLRMHKTTFDTAAFTSLGRLRTLRSIRVANCKWFTGKEFKFFENTPLRELYISDADLLDSSLRYLRNQSNLDTFLIVNNLQFTGAGLADLTGCTSLRDLRVSELPNFSDKSFAHIAKLHSIRSLTLIADSYQPGRAEDDLAFAVGGPSKKPYDLESFDQITSMKQLETLSLDSDRLESRHFDSLSKMKSLRKLTFVGRQKIAAQDLARLSKVRTLNTIETLGPCFATGCIKQVSGMPNIKRLALYNSELTDAMLAEIPKSTVAELIIDGENSVSGIGLAYIAQMPKLTLLHLPHPKASHLTALDLRRFRTKTNCKIE